MRTVIAIAAVWLALGAAPPRLAAEGADLAGAVSAQRFVVFAQTLATPGDVLFIRGRGIWGAMAARFSNRDRTFGHVGLVVADDAGRLAVIHAGGDPASPGGRVKQESLEDFLDGVKVVAVYAPSVDQAVKVNAIAFAQNAVQSSAPFDRQFSLASDEALYCTELIWRAYSQALGEDVIPNKSVRENIPYIALDDLQDAAFLYEKDRLF